MFCGNCGKENDNGAKFCKECGHALNGTDNQNITNNTSSVSQENIVASGALGKIKNLPKKMVYGTIGGVIALIIIICVAVNSGSTINLNKYLTVEAEGYDGYGIIKTSIDWDAIEEKYGSKITYKSAAKNEYGGFLSFMTPLEVVQECVSIKIDENSLLSNGDSIAYTWEIDNNLQDYVKCKIKYKDGNYKVSNLAKIETFDAFADVEVIFSGVSPSGKVEINYTGSELNPYDFTCDKSSGLMNGDTVIVQMSNNDMSYYAEKLGKIPESTTKIYTVNGLQEYVMYCADLTEDFKNKLKKEAEDAIYSYTASTYDKSSSLNNLEYAGCALNSVKDAESWYSDYNDLYIIYKGDVSSSEGNFPTSKVYFPVKFSNILKGTDGQFSCDNNCAIYGSSRLGKGWFVTKGYLNPVLCYMDIVDSHGEAYVVECADGFELYSNYINIENLDDFSETFKETIYSDAKNMIMDYVNEEDYNITGIGDLSVVGEYLLTAKVQEDDIRYNNKYVVVYSSTISTSNKKVPTATVYFPVEFDGIVKLSDGQFITTEIVGLLGRSRLSDDWWFQARGYADGKQMYTEIITANRDKYNYEISENLKEFGE